jgi:hypothetical protein
MRIETSSQEAGCPSSTKILTYKVAFFEYQIQKALSCLESGVPNRIATTHDILSEAVGATWDEIEEEMNTIYKNQ